MYQVLCIYSIITVVLTYIITLYNIVITHKLNCNHKHECRALRPVMVQSFWSARVLVPECFRTRNIQERTFQRSVDVCRNLPMTSCRTVELKSSRHSKRSIVCSRIRSQRDSKTCFRSGPTRLIHLSGRSRNEETRENYRLNSGPFRRTSRNSDRWVCAGFLLTLAVTSCSARRRFQVSGGIFSVMNLVVKKSIRAKLIFKERRRGGEEAAGQEIAEAVRVLCIHAQFTADQSVRQRGVKKTCQLILVHRPNIPPSDI